MGRNTVRTWSWRSFLMPFRCGKIFAVNHVDLSVRKGSSSGGAFYALAMYVLEHAGYVIGAGYNGTMVEHMIVDRKEDLWKLQKSKYAPSSLSKIDFPHLLKAGKLVLFSGTPCQVKGLARYKDEYPNLILVEIACHGMPTRKSYLDYIERNDIVKIDFRCKRNGWKATEIELIKKDGSILYEENVQNEYYKDFLSGKIMRQSCYTCQSKYFTSRADFTLADAWGVNDFAPELADDRGTSLVFLHTKDAIAIWSACSTLFNSKRVCLADAIRYNAGIVRPIDSMPILVEKCDELKILILRWLYNRFLSCKILSKKKL